MRQIQQVFKATLTSRKFQIAHQTDLIYL